MSTLHEGATLGPYRVIEQVGMGGMATVYRAYQPNMDRYVALKILPAYYAQDPKFVERFNREARTIAKLEHKHILPVYDFGEDREITYLVMRYVDGGTLKSMLGLGRLTLSDGVEIIEEVCSALDYAHRQGVIHRDVKPANVIVDSEGAAYLTDFGIAKVLENTDALTETGGTIGTPAYMAPEQSTGKQVDARSDIYSVGVILYEIVVGQAPFQADTPMAIALAHIHEPLPLPRSIDPNIPAPIETVILKALAKDPNDRFQTAGELSQALKSALAQSGVHTGETTLRALVTMAQSQVASQTIKVQPGQFRPGVMDANAVPVPEPARRGRPLPVLGLIIGAVILVAVIAGGLLLSGVLGGPPTASVPTETASPVTASVRPTSIVSTFVDDFSDSQFDGRANPALWRLDSNSRGCGYAQKEGILALDYQPFTSVQACYLSVIRPDTVLGANLGTVEFRMRVRAGHQGGIFNARMFNITYFGGENHWLMDCRMVGTPEGSFAEFWTGRMTNGVQGTDYSETLGIDEDVWHTIQMTVDPETMESVCLLDGAVLGTYTPADAAELRSLPFTRTFSGDSEPGVTATVEIDDVVIEPGGN